MKLQLVSFALAALTAPAAAQDLVGLVKDIYPGATSSNPIGLAMYDSKVYFAAGGEGTGVELYVSDGNTNGTMMVKDINPGMGSSNPSDFAVFGDKLFFRADDGTSGSELWVTDGTTEGTSLFLDINPGAASSKPGDFVVLGDLMVFEATTPEYGEELWVSDGTPEGTMLLTDLYVGTASSSPSLREEYKVGDKLVFTADDGVNGLALFSTNGTAAGTTLLTNLTEGSTSIEISRSKENATEIFFAMGAGFWVTDGTVNGTMVLEEGITVGGPSRIAAYSLNGKTFFFGTTDGSSDSLWQTDGSVLGTRAVFADLDSPETSQSGAASVFGLGFGPVLNGKISLITDNGVGVNIWVTDGNTLSLLLEDTYDWVLDAKISMDESQVLFQVRNGTALELWSTDYTSQNTVLISAFPGGVDTTTGDSIAISGNETLFTVDTPESGVELWKVEFPELVLPPTPQPTSSPVALPTAAPIFVPSPTRAPTPQFSASAMHTTSLSVVATIVGAICVVYAL